MRILKKQIRGDSVKILNISEKLVDAKQQSLDHSATFYYPEEEVKHIKESDYVKICHNAERFWVMLTNVNGDELTGFVNTDLVNKQPFKLDDKVSFQKRHIFQIYGE
jgi:hypothetical protein